MANYTNHALGKVLPSGVEKVSTKGNRYYLQSIELFSHINEDGYPQFVKEAFFLEKPLPEGRCLLRFEHNQKGGPPQLQLVAHLSASQFNDVLALLSRGPSKKSLDGNKPIFTDITPETRMRDLINGNDEKEDEKESSFGDLG